MWKDVMGTLSRGKLLVVFVLVAVLLLPFLLRNEVKHTATHEWCHRWDDPEYRVTILCLGDSITYGSGSHNLSLPTVQWKNIRGNYPVSLHSLVVETVRQRAAELRCRQPPTAEQVVVKNYGVSGASVTPSSIWYQQTNEYRQAVVAAKNAAIAVVMLGTNDSKEWVNQSYFEEHYLSLINGLRREHPGIIIVVVSPPPSYPMPRPFIRDGTCRDVYSIVPRLVSIEIQEACKAVAVRGKLHLLDMYAALVTVLPPIAELENQFFNNCPSDMSEHDRGRLGKIIVEYFTDGVHPAALTSQRIASVVAARVSPMLMLS